MGYPPEKGQAMKWWLVAGGLAAFAYQPGECPRLAPIVDPCKADVEGHYLRTEGCPVYVPERVEDKDCDDHREPCHYRRERPANVENSTQERMRG